MAYILLSVVLFFSSLTGELSDQPHLDWTKHKLIAHAFGGIDGHTYTNSKEAFLLNYSKGHRLFEIDLSLTSDNKLVLRHEWSLKDSELLQQDPPDDKGTPWSYDYFVNQKINKIYTPLDIEQVMDLMREYPDMYIVTDTKQTESSIVRLQFQLLVAAANDDPRLLDRIIPQIYNQQMLDEIGRIYKFPNIIYTLYLSKDSNEQVIQFVKEKQIKVVAMPEARVKADFVAKLKENGALTFVHTINSADAAKKYEEVGVFGFYTDVLTKD